MRDVKRLNVRDPAKARDLAVHRKAGVLEHGLPGIIVAAGHVVVGVVARNDHQRAQDNGRIARSLNFLDDGLAGGLLRLALDRADKDVLVAELLHLGAHLAVAHLGNVRRAVAEEYECSAGLLGRFE